MTTETLPTHSNPSDEDATASDSAAPCTTPSTDAANTTAIFPTILAANVQTVDPIEVARFLGKRERYELEIKEKAAELPSLKAVGFTASFGRSLLKSLVYMDDLEPFAI